MFAILSYLAAAVLIVSTLLIGFVSVFQTPGVIERLQQQAVLAKANRAEAKKVSVSGQSAPPGSAKIRIKDAAVAAVSPATAAEAASEKKADVRHPVPGSSVPTTASKAPARKSVQHAHAPPKSLIKRRPAAAGYDEYTAHFNRAPRGWFSEQID